jgi:hypothetical protein
MPNIRLADFYRLNSRFMRSANLVRDFPDAAALNGYIPTEQTRKTAARLAAGLRQTSRQRAWRITGDYGAGKSSFALLLANLFSANESGLPPRLRKVIDPGQTPSKKLLPALVLGDRERISTSILKAIYLALKSSNANTKRSKNVTGLLSALSAAQVSPLANDRAILLIEEANDFVISSGVAGGLLIILDELGKFLEFAANHQDSEDIYFLQLLAEAACRAPEHPLFVVALLHQGFSAYADKLSQAAQKEWEKVAERFEEIFFTHSLDQITLLIAEALDIRTDKFPKRYEAAKRNEMEETLRLGWFGAGASETALLDHSLRIFPLHATVLPVLPKIFNRFGQNERSLFSFLLANEPFGLQEALEVAILRGTQK